MTDELPEIFDRLQPQPAPPELRPRVLAAIERELARRKKPRWERALELGVAASLVVGVGWNLLQWRADIEWQRPTRSTPTVAANEQDLVDVVASITDHTTARMLIDRLVSARLRPPDPHQPLAVDANDSVKN